MAVLSLLLDTNILWHRKLCRDLADRMKVGAVEVYIPTLVHAERIRQIADQYGDRFALTAVRQYIDDTGFHLLPLTIANAEMLSKVWLELKQTGVDSTYWQQHRFDILLCAIARSTGYTLVVEDRGLHFETVVAKMSILELEALISLSE